MAKIILVGGGTASGKTYVIRKVVEQLGTDKVTHFSIDDYYKDLTNLSMEERKKQNFDHPKAFDWKLMKEQLTALNNLLSLLALINIFKSPNSRTSLLTRAIIPSTMIKSFGSTTLVSFERL